jgi:hypothetical protein
VSALPKKTAFSWPTHALKERMKKKFLTTATTIQLSFESFICGLINKRSVRPTVDE